MDKKQGHRDISIHTPHAGSDLPTSIFGVTAVTFQSTLPMRGATHIRCIFQIICKFQSTLPMRGATSWKMLYVADRVFQSTLPMRGATCYGVGVHHFDFDFNPHSPCGERLHNYAGALPCFLFQSTLPMRGATKTYPQLSELIDNFNPHSPCGERLPSC